MYEVTTRDALMEYFEEQGLRDPDQPADAWYRDAWYRIRIGGRRVPVLPLYGLKRARIKHDVHHMLTGYATSWKGELELAGWELASGGCAFNLPFWVDRAAGFLIGLLIVPGATLRAFRAGLGQRNLYYRRCRAVLAADVDTARGWITR